MILQIMIYKRTAISFFKNKTKQTKQENWTKLESSNFPLQDFVYIASHLTWNTT